MFMLIVYSVIILENMKSSSIFFQVILCPDIKNDKLARQQAITIYQRVTLQFIFTLYNIKILCSFERRKLGFKSD